MSGKLQHAIHLAGRLRMELEKAEGKFDGKDAEDISALKRAVVNVERRIRNVHKRTVRESRIVEKAGEA